MIDPRCAVQVGVHPTPFWVDKNSGLQVCNRHKEQYDEIEDSSREFDWEKLHLMEIVNASD